MLNFEKIQYFKNNAVGMIFLYFDRGIKTITVHKLKIHIFLFAGKFFTRVILSFLIKWRKYELQMFTIIIT